MALGFGLDVGSGETGGFTSYVNINPALLAAFLRSPSGPAMRATMKVGEQVKDLARSYVGVHTGNLRDHIVMRVVESGSTFMIVVGADVPYAIYHHEGSDAVEGTLMVFTTKGGDLVFTMRRAAIPANRFLTDALAQAHL